jgi:hypothetical protein
MGFRHLVLFGAPLSGGATNASAQGAKRFAALRRQQTTTPTVAARGIARAQLNQAFMGHGLPQRVRPRRLSLFTPLADDGAERGRST